MWVLLNSFLSKPYITYTLFVTPKIEFSNPPILQFSNLKGCKYFLELIDHWKGVLKSSLAFMQHFKLENWRLENWRNGEFDFWCHEKVTNDFCWKSFKTFSSTQGSIEIKSFNGIPNSKVAKTTPETRKRPRNYTNPGSRWPSHLAMVNLFVTSKNEFSNSPIHELKVLQNVFKMIKKQGLKCSLK